MIDKLLTPLRDNARLRWGLAAIIGILWLYGVLILRDAVQLKSQEHTNVARSLARLRAELTQPEWVDRVAPAKALAVQLESRLWQAPTSGLAQAAFQEWINSTIAQSGAKNAQIANVAIEEGEGEPNAAKSPLPNGLRKVSAKVRFDFAAPTLLNVLNLIESNEKLTTVSSLVVRRDPPASVELDVSAVFQKQDSADKDRPKDNAK